MTQRDEELPAGFESLEAFVPFWAAASAAERANRRDISSESERLAFYTAMKPLATKALDSLNATALAQLNEQQQRLMLLLLSFAHVSIAVETQREEEPRHAVNRPFLRITRAPADLPAA